MLSDSKLESKIYFKTLDFLFIFKLLHVLENKFIFLIETEKIKKMTKQWHWADINGHNCFPFPCRKLLQFVSIIYMEEIILTSYLFKVDTPSPKNSIIDVGKENGIVLDLIGKLLLACQSIHWSSTN